MNKILIKKDNLLLDLKSVQKPQLFKLLSSLLTVKKKTPDQKMRIVVNRQDEDEDKDEDEDNSLMSTHGWHRDDHIRGKKKENRTTSKIKMKMRRKLLSFVLYIIVSFQTERSDLFFLLESPSAITVVQSWGPAFNSGRDVRKISLTFCAFRFAFSFLCD